MYLFVHDVKQSSELTVGKIHSYSHGPLIGGRALSLDVSASPDPLWAVDGQKVSYNMKKWQFKLDIIALNGYCFTTQQWLQKVTLWTKIILAWSVSAPDTTVNEAYSQCFFGYGCTENIGTIDMDFKLHTPDVALLPQNSMTLFHTSGFSATENTIIWGICLLSTV